MTRIAAPQLPIWSSAQPLEDAVERCVREVEDLTACAFADETLTGTVSRIEVRACRFDRCRFSGCRFDRAGFTDVVFCGCDFSNADLSRCSLAALPVRGLQGCRAAAGACGAAQRDVCALPAGLREFFRGLPARAFAWSRTRWVNRCGCRRSSMPRGVGRLPAGRRQPQRHPAARYGPDYRLAGGIAARWGGAARRRGHAVPGGGICPAAGADGQMGKGRIACGQRRFVCASVFETAGHTIRCAWHCFAADVRINHKTNLRVVLTCDV